MQVCVAHVFCCFFFSSRRRHTRFDCDWSSDVCSSDLLGAIPVLAPGRHTPIPAASLVHFTPMDAPSELLRENQQQMIMMTADLGARGLRSVMTDVTEALAQHPPPTDIRVELGGQYASQQAAFGALVLVLGLAAALVCGRDGAPPPHPH